MATNTAERDAWVATMLGVDLSRYARAADAAAPDATAPGTPAPGTAGPGAAPGRGAGPSGRAKPAKAPPKSEVQTRYEALLKTVEDRCAAAGAGVTAGEIAAIGSECIEPAKALAGAATPDFDGAMARLAKAAKRLDMVELHKRRYEAGLKAAEDRFKSLSNNATKAAALWPGWGGAPIKGVTEVIPELTTKYLDPGRAKAAAGDYAAAMALLDAASQPESDAFGKVNAFWDFATSRNLAALTYDATLAGAVPAVAAALAAIKAETLDKADAAAKAGDYAAASAMLAAAGPKLAPLSELVARRNAALGAVGGLAAPELAEAKAKLQHDRLDAGDAQVAAGKLAEAGALYAQGAEEAGKAAPYGTALAAANAALAKATDPALAPDLARIKADCMDPAKARAGALDFAGGAALLAEAAKQAGALGKLSTAQAEAEGANAKAQKKAKANPAGALADVKKLLAALEHHPSAGTIGDALTRIRDDVADAGGAISAGTLDTARTLIEKAGKGIVDARMQAERNAQYDAALDAAKTRVAGLPAEAGPEKAQIESGLLTPAGAKYTAGDREAGMKGLSGVAPACVAAEATAALARQYATERPKADAALATLTDAFVAPDKDRVKTTMLDPAAAKATSRDFAAALKLIEPVATSCATIQRIAGANAEYADALSSLNDAMKMLDGNIKYGKAKHMPERPEFAAGLQDVRTSFAAPAAAKLAGRAIGPDGLPDMQEAVRLAQEGGTKCWALVDQSFALFAAGDQAKKAADAVAAVKALPQHEAIAREIATLDKQLADGAAMLAAGQNAPAVAAYRLVIDGAADATKLAGEAARYAASVIASNLRIGVCRMAVTNAAPIQPIIDRLAAVEAETITAAAAQEALHDYVRAAALLEPVSTRCGEVEALVLQNAKFAAAITPLEASLAKLTQNQVAGEVTRIRAERIDPAKAAAGTTDYPTAFALLDKAKAEIEAAEKVAAGAKEAQDGRDGAQAALDGEDAAARIDAVQKLLDALLAHPQAAAIKDMTDRIATAIAGAKKKPAPADAAEKLKQAADLSVEARAEADRAGGCAAAIADVEAKLAALADPVVRADVAAIRKDQLEPARKLAQTKGRDLGKAQALLDQARDACAKAQAIVEKEAAFQAAATAAQAALDGLAAVTPPDPAIGADAAALQADAIDTASAMSDMRDYDGAMKLLATVAPACKALALKKTMVATTPPTKAQIRDLMAQPGGAAQLDRMVASLPESVPSEVMQAAIEARFGIASFKNLTKTGDASPTATGRSTVKSLKRIYELMAKVPSGNVLDNPSLKQVELYGGKTGEAENNARGSFYTEGKIVLSCGRAEDSNKQPLDDVALSLPDVDPDSEMVPDSEVPAPKYFDWTTLHEVAHAIDDKTGFMDRRLGNAQFGNWQVHEGDIAPVARAVAGACGLAGPAGEGYLAGYLAGAKAPPPAAPAGRADWDQAIKQAQEWCDAIRVDKELWESGSGASSRAVGGRVYHEAYKGRWVSYDLAARSKGVSGYQFRAPGEWLSELYAAYHSKKLKPSHPAVAWLATL